MAEWEKIIPKVNESAEFLEIASDFGDQPVHILHYLRAASCSPRL